jgi:hypothetical protein
MRQEQCLTSLQVEPENCLGKHLAEGAIPTGFRLTYGFVMPRTWRLN